MSCLFVRQFRAASFFLLTSSLIILPACSVDGDALFLDPNELLSDDDTKDPDTLGLDPDPQDDADDQSTDNDQDDSSANTDDDSADDDSADGDGDGSSNDADDTSSNEDIDDTDEPPASDDDSKDDADQPSDDSTENDEDADDEQTDADSDGVAIPQNDYCVSATDWPEDWSDFENQVLELVNQRRASGADCGTEGTFGPAGPLSMNGALQCAARNHSLDMRESGFFSHTNQAGESPGDRVDLAEYVWSTWGENIAWGQTSPQQVVDAWMNSDGHCSNIMAPSFTEIGVGYYEGNYWTQVFGAPR